MPDMVTCTARRDVGGIGKDLVLLVMEYDQKRGRVRVICPMMAQRDVEAWLDARDVQDPDLVPIDDFPGYGALSPEYVAGCLR